VIRRAVDARAARLATQRWLGLGPAARQRRWAALAAAASAREVYGSLLDLYGNSRPPTDPYLVAEVLRRPDPPGAARHDRTSTHEETLGVRPGSRLGLLLEDWFHLPATLPSSSPDVIEPHFVTVSAAQQGRSVWLVEVAYVFIFEDGWTLKPDAVDILPREIRTVGRHVPWEPSGEVPEASAQPGLTLREVGTRDRIAADPDTAAGSPVRLRSPRYYRCPCCAGRTRLLPARLAHDAEWKGPPSPFEATLKARFDAFRPVSAPEFTFDFRCQRCERPVRLVYHFAELGMGGPWHAVITSLVEVEDPAAEVVGPRACSDAKR
jgi:hypothetical protein